MLFEIGRADEATQHQKAAADAFKSLVFEAGFLTETNLYLSELETYARSLMFLGNVEAAKQVFDEAVRMSDAQLQRDNARDNRNFAALVRLGRGSLILNEDPRDVAGLRDVTNALKRWSVLTKEFESYLNYQQYLARAKLALADSLIANADLDAAATFVNEAYDVLQTKIDEFDLFTWKPYLVDALATKSRLAAAYEDKNQSRKHLEAAIELQEHIVSINPDSQFQAKRLRQLQEEVVDLPPPPDREPTP